MCKKITLGVLGLALVAGLLFGGNLVPYGQTAIQKIRRGVNNSVDVDFQLDAAKNQLEKIGPQIVGMVHEIAKEKVQIKRIAADLDRQDEMLEKSYDKMMTLRGHLESSDEYYVATNNKKYTRSRVEEDLRHRFTLHKTAEATRNKQQEILKIRRDSLESALSKLDTAKAQQRELEVQIESLTARNRMNEVIASASKLNIDSSQISKTRQMLDEIDARISAKEEVLNIAPEYYGGQIPVGEELQDSSNILDDLDTYFQKPSGQNDDHSEIDFNSEI